MLYNDACIYDMGNGTELTQNDCSYFGLAKEIITLKYLDKEVLNADMEAALEAEAKEFAINFYRTDGGYLSQIKSHLNLDLESFDKQNFRHQSEIFKILYLFYQLKNKFFPKVEVIQLLGKPSMENIGSSVLGYKTYNGDIVNKTKSLLEQEIEPQAIKNIKNALSHVTMAWDDFLNCIRIQTDLVGCDFNFEQLAHSLKAMSGSFTEVSTKKHELSPNETLYFRILQREYLGQIKDILLINKIRIDSNYNVPLEMIEEMTQLCDRKIELSYVEEYIDKNAFRIAKYIYLKTDTSKGERQKIRYNKKKVLKIIDFCIRARPLINMQEETTELFIISCLQAILTDSRNETFDYVFHGYQEYTKHKPRVQAALKNGGNTVDALKLYWERKVLDHWYANIGRYDIRCRLRELENECDNLLVQILSSSSILEMLEINSSILKQLNEQTTLF